MDQRCGPTAKHARPRGQRGRSGGILTGVILVVIGTLFLLHNLGLADFDFDWRAWPLFLVLFGIVRLVGHRDRSSGLWLVAIGLWLYANENRVWGLDYENSWPFLLVFGGIMMVGKALRGSAVSEDPAQEGGSRGSRGQEGGTP